MVYKSIRMQRRYQREYKYSKRHGMKWNGPSFKTSEWHKRLSGKKRKVHWTDIGSQLVKKSGRVRTRRTRNGIRGAF